MKIRYAVLPVALLAFVAFVVPTAAAQPQPKMEIAAKWASDHPEHELNKDGRDNMPITVTLKVQDFVCAQPFELSVVIVAEHFEKWAGASPENALVTFSIPAQEPGTAPGKTYEWKDKTRLNFAWDLETAPRQGAVQSYFVKPSDYKKSQSKTGPCVPDPPAPALIRSSEMKVSLPDRLDDNSTIDGEDCSVNPEQAKCQTSAIPVEDSPAPGVMVLLGAVGLVAYLRRRQE